MIVTMIYSDLDIEIETACLSRTEGARARRRIRNNAVFIDEGLQAIQSPFSFTKTRY